MVKLRKLVGKINSTKNINVDGSRLMCWCSVAEVKIRKTQIDKPSQMEKHCVGEITKLKQQTLATHNSKQLFNKDLCQVLKYYE